MGTPVEIFECILVYCLLQNVDRETQLLWEDAAPTERLPVSASADVFRSAFQLMYNQLINKSQNQQN